MSICTFSRTQSTFSKGFVCLLLCFVCLAGCVAPSGSRNANDSPDQRRGWTIRTHDLWLLPDAANVDSLQPVKQVRIAFSLDEKKTLRDVFYDLKREASNQGANSYTIVEGLDCVRSEAPCELVADTYFATKDALERSYADFQTNRVYVFGDLEAGEDEKRVKINGETVSLAPMTYVEVQNEVGGEVTVSKGGFLGAKVTYKGREGRLPLYLSFSSFGVGPGRPGEIGLSFNTGRVYPMDPALGLFLVATLGTSDKASTLRTQAAPSE